jgi:hypothetical protein
MEVQEVEVAAQELLLTEIGGGVVEIEGDNVVREEELDKVIRVVLDVLVGEDVVIEQSLWVTVVVKQVKIPPLSSVVQPAYIVTQKLTVISARGGPVILGVDVVDEDELEEVLVVRVQSRMVIVVVKQV